MAKSAQEAPGAARKAQEAPGAAKKLIGIAQVTRMVFNAALCT